MEMTKFDLANLYYNRSNKEAADFLGVSVVTLLKTIDEAGIKRKGSGSHKRNRKIKIIEG